jgi:hypothetical protein
MGQSPSKKTATEVVVTFAILFLVIALLPNGMVVRNPPGMPLVSLTLNVVPFVAGSLFLWASRVAGSWVFFAAAILNLGFSTLTFLVIACCDPRWYVGVGP